MLAVWMRDQRRVDRWCKGGFCAWRPSAHARRPLTSAVPVSEHGGRRRVGALLRRVVGEVAVGQSSDLEGEGGAAIAGAAVDLVEPGSPGILAQQVQLARLAAR